MSRRLKSRLPVRTRRATRRAVFEPLEDRALLATMAYVTDGNPWGGSPDSNVAAMNAVFGAGNWDQFSYSSPGSVLGGAYKFILLEGGNGVGPAFESFVNANRTTLENLASSGAAILMNAARNSFSSLAFNAGFGGDAHRSGIR